MKNLTKGLLSLVMMASLAFTSSAQVNIGSGTLTDQALPIEPFYGYTYSQSIYLASEINASGTITGVSFYADPGSSITNSNDWTVYVGHTTKSTFAGNTDWETGLTEVFTGIVTSVGDIVTITFTTPFAYNGTDNLIVAVDENAASFNGSGDDFLCTSVSGDRALTYRDDSVNPDPLAPPTASFVRQAIPNIQFIGIAPTCISPSALAVSNITATTADVAWTAGNAVQLGWEVSVVPSGNTPVGGTPGTSTYNATGLTADTDYDVYVREICSPGDTTGWLGPIAFSTPCATVTPTYLTDFATFMPSCWDVAGDGTTSTGPTSLGGSNWGQNGTAARINLYSDFNSDWLLSPTFDLSAGPWELVINAEANDYLASVFSGMGSDDSVQVVVSTDGGTTWTEIYSFNTSNQPTLAAANYIVDLSAYTGTSNMFGIRAADGPVNDAEDYYFTVNSFEIRTPPSCTDPTMLAVGNITATTADVTWTAGNAVQLGWEVSIVPTGNAPMGGTPAAASPYNAMGLTGNTDYDVYVREICGPGDTTAWVGPVAFSTPCAVFTPAYLTDFATFVPTCWDQAGDGTILTGPTAVGTSNWGQNGTAARINLYSDFNTDWLLSPTFDLSAGPWELVINAEANDYLASTFSGMGSDDSVQVVVSTDGGTTWTEIYSFNTSNQPALTAANYIVDLSAYTGTSNMFGIRAADGPVNDAEDYYFTVNSFEIRTPPTCADPTALNVTNIMPTAADINWTAGNAVQLGWEVSIVPTGNAPMGGTPSATTTYNATGLTDNTDFDVYVREICAPGDTTGWLGPIAFSTPCLPFDGDDATTPIVITGLTVSTTGNTDQCFTNQSFSVGGDNAPDAWYEYTLDTCTDSLIVSLCGSSFDTYLRVYAADGTTVIVANDDNFAECGPGNNSHIELDINATAGINAGDLIYIVVDGYNASQGAYSLNIEQIQAPTPVIDAQTACDTYDWNGTTYTTSGQYSFMSTDVNGCDSLTILDLTISTSTTGTDVITACDSLIWVDGVTYYASTNTPTFTLANSAGCDSTLTLDLTIIPNAAPVPDAANLPDLTDECSVTPTAPTATDDCSGAITGTPDVTFPITTQGTTVVTWTFDDGAGLTATQTQNVIITDVTPPTASNPPTLQVQCISDVPAATPGAVTDEADNCGTPTVAFVSEMSDGQTCPETITRTYSVTDVGGNMITVTQTIIVNDNVLPIADMAMLPTETGFCDVTPATPTATDNCSGTINGVPDVTFPINTPGTTTVTWTFTDDCGNAITQTQDVVIDQIDVNTSFASDGITILASNQDPGVTYQWYNCTEDTLMTGETNFNFTPTFSADFAVIVTQDGCVDTSACVTITGVGIEDIILNAVQVYPNPVKDAVNVDLAGLENATVRLLDMSGKVLREEESETTELFTMEMNEAPGAYIIEVQSNEFVRQFKLIKE